MVKLIVSTLAVLMLSTPLLAMECVGRSKAIKDCPNPIFKVGKYTENGQQRKRMFCVCQADFAALNRMPNSDSEKLQHKMEIEIWSKRFALTPDEFKALISR